MTTLDAVRFEVVEGWEQLPEGFVHKDVSGVAVDSCDRVYLITRMDARVIVYEPDGTFRQSFADGAFKGRPHGITIGPGDVVYCVDDGEHTVRKFAPDGELLMVIGTPGVASDTGYDGRRLKSIVRGGAPFNRPTNVAVAPNGDLYVSDGYGNARVHHFSPEGRLIRSWGEPGTGPGQFNLVHDVAVDANGRVLVADRENDRIQLFSPEGEFVEQWTHVQRPAGICIRDGLVYVSELAWRVGMRSMVHGPIAEYRPARVSVLSMDGSLLTRWGGPDPCAAGSFCSAHGIAVDSLGAVYVAEATYSSGVSAGLVPPDCHTFQKFVPVKS